MKSNNNKMVWCYASNKNKSAILHGRWLDIMYKKVFDWSSLSRAYHTKRELVSNECILPKPCNECGSPISANYLNKEDLIKKNLCFGCDFWSSKIPIKDDANTVRVNGVHYRITPDNAKAAFQGFGAHEFKIKFNDGRNVVTHNLWCQGEIPVIFKDRLPDNAKFL